MDDRRVVGRCPMGCGETLFLADGGYVTCGYLPCPAPDRAADMLDRLPAFKQMADHAVSLVLDRWTARGERDATAVPDLPGTEATPR